MKDRFRFRVWSTYNERYMYEYQSNPDYAEIIDDSNYIFEQCTGSKDCYSDLIYEGDILEIWEDMGISYVAVVWNDEQKKWDIEGDTEGDYDFWELVDREVGDKNNDVGVVGNIHENSDLLKEKEN